MPIEIKGIKGMEEENYVNPACNTCNGKAIHYLHYGNKNVSWEGNYCNDCFVKKFRDMVKVWVRKGKNNPKQGGGGNSN